MEIFDFQIGFRLKSIKGFFDHYQFYKNLKKL